jgi:hypothetical protein
MLLGEANMTTDDVSQEGRNDGPSEEDDRLDEVEEESFPASDPQSSWAGPNTESGE